jgi:hypothetical protein
MNQISTTRAAGEGEEIIPPKTKEKKAFATEQKL